MTVYVGPIELVRGTKRRYAAMLFADNTFEVKAFASRRLKIDPHNCLDDYLVSHFWLTGAMRARAIQKGARAVSSDILLDRFQYDYLRTLLKEGQE